MPVEIDPHVTPEALQTQLDQLWEVSANKIHSIDRTCPPGKPAPVYTVNGQYTARGWTEWTQGFQHGAAFLQFDAQQDESFLALGRRRTADVMAHHVTHFGVHDHGFNNVSTYGNLWRLIRENRVHGLPNERAFCELALACSGAIQARRWTPIHDGRGFLYSFNGPHSLFADTMRTLRSLSLAHWIGHITQGENDKPIPLFQRLLDHGSVTADFNVYFGKNRDIYDVRGRVAHESLFNTNDGRYRCPSTQQGYSPFSTWTRGLAWVMLGFVEQLEFMAILPDTDFGAAGRAGYEHRFLEAATATADFYLANTPIDGVPYWDTGAPGLARMGDYLARPAEPFNTWEPVDSSAAAIACQGLLRLGAYLGCRKDACSYRYQQAGLTILKTLLSPTYLSTDGRHQGLLLHAVYHRPNGWDSIPEGCNVPSGEACLWGDYHLREVALMVLRMAENRPYMTFFGPPILQ